MRSIFCCALLLTFGAAWMDLRSTKVDNSWLLFWLFIGVLQQLLWQESGTIPTRILGFWLPLLLLFPFFLFRMLGAGDIKLLAVLGSFLGGEDMLTCLFFIFVAAACLSLSSFLLDGGWRERWQYFCSYLQRVQQTGQRLPYCRPEVHAESLHMTIPILLGTLLWIAWKYTQL